MTLSAEGQVLGGWPDLNRAERSALREVLVHGPLPRTEIARRLGLSRASLTRMARTLLDEGLVAEGGVEMRARTGRPSELLRSRDDSFRLMGVKLTGDTVYAVLTDLRARVLASVSEPIENPEFSAVVAQVTRLHGSLAASGTAIVALGVCLAGDIVTEAGRRMVASSPYLGWVDVDLVGALTARLAIPVVAENDVRALTALEHWFGAAVDLSSFALVTVGAGLGFGFVIGGRVLTGNQGRAGRLDHLRIDPDGPPCGLGHRGCASSYLTSGSIVLNAGRPDLDYDGVVRAARAGEPGPVQAFRDAGYALGTLLATVANVIDPEAIILTGDGLAVVEIARDAVDEAIALVRDPADAETPLEIQGFGFAEWARAGAVTALRELLGD
ncbi:ROK family transcriptional regulator [Serinibacter arcticus]|uniref:ROK family transcriptional regulator n=1 Tax=Serinibacter arcticus TaxID=1655435 RepID=A0A2U1ZSD9_9MICO|nr:ROK family protein [Serinibacter arcticus]PWD49899.1 ROK family transcriptional regulator [Serinibacter arcticus]